MLLNTGDGVEAGTADWIAAGNDWLKLDPLDAGGAGG
jgi:hypothetical protein